MTRPPVPLPLKIVAALFILGGASSAIEVIVALTRNQVNINLGVLGILSASACFDIRQTGERSAWFSFGSR